MEKVNKQRFYIALANVNKRKARKAAQRKAIVRDTIQRKLEEIELNKLLGSIDL